MTVAEQLANLSDEGIEQLCEEFDAGKLERMILLVLEQQGREIETDAASLKRAIHAARVFVQCEKMRRDGLLEIESYPASYISSDGVIARMTDKGEAEFHRLQAEANG